MNIVCFYTKIRLNIVYFEYEDKTEHCLFLYEDKTEHCYFKIYFQKKREREKMNESDIYTYFMKMDCNPTIEDLTKIINYTKIRKNKDTLSTLYFIIGFYYRKINEYKNSIKYFKLHQVLCKKNYFQRFLYKPNEFPVKIVHSQQHGDTCFKSHKHLSACYFKIGKEKEGIIELENYMIRYKKWHENNYEYFHNSQEEFVDSLKFSKNKFKSKW